MSWNTLLELYSKNYCLFHNNGQDLAQTERNIVSTFTLYIAQATSALVFGAPIFQELAKINDSNQLEIFCSSNAGDYDPALQHLMCFDALEQVKDLCGLNHEGTIQLEHRINAEPVIIFFQKFVAENQPNTIISLKNFTSDVMRRNIDELSNAANAAYRTSHHSS